MWPNVRACGETRTKRDSPAIDPTCAAHATGKGGGGATPGTYAYGDNSATYGADARPGGGSAYGDDSAAYGAAGAGAGASPYGGDSSMYVGRGEGRCPPSPPPLNADAGRGTERRPCSAFVAWVAAYSPGALVAVCLQRGGAQGAAQ